MGRVYVAGSVNIDLVMAVQRLPRPGETVTDGTLARHDGGKGGNQAVAAARLGADVRMIACVGEGESGDRSIDALDREGVDCRHVARSAQATGTALILVDASGQNSIAVAPGANRDLGAEHVEAALAAVTSGDVVLVSLEIPVESAMAALRTGSAAGATTVLNPAPVRPLPRTAFENVGVVVPNEIEVEAYGGSVQALLDQGAEGVVVTLGAEGAEYAGRAGESGSFRPPPVDAVDTTGAGDAFCGALAASLAEGGGLREAVRRAVAAGAFATTAAGARGALARPADL